MENDGLMFYDDNDASVLTDAQAMKLESDMALVAAHGLDAMWQLRSVTARVVADAIETDRMVDLKQLVVAWKMVGVPRQTHQGRTKFAMDIAMRPEGELVRRAITLLSEQIRSNPPGRTPIGQ